MVGACSTHGTDDTYNNIVGEPEKEITQEPETQTGMDVQNGLKSLGRKSVKRIQLDQNMIQQLVVFENGNERSGCKLGGDYGEQPSDNKLLNKSLRSLLYNASNPYSETPLVD